jgi:hypothetical protein
MEEGVSRMKFQIFKKAGPARHSPWRSDGVSALALGIAL